MYKYRVVIELYKQSQTTTGGREEGACCTGTAKDIEGFDVVFLFSITMWVHLTNGDDGLRQFIESSCNLTKNVLIVEPQNWCSYKSAMKRCRQKHIDRSANFKSIAIKGEKDVKEHINNLITKRFGLENRVDFGTDTWARSIIGFHRSTFDLRINDLIPLTASVRLHDFAN